jgi:hypothetical protein
MWPAQFLYQSLFYGCCVTFVAYNISCAMLRTPTNYNTNISYSWDS